MNTDDRTKEIDSVFKLLVAKLKERLRSPECTDKDMTVALRFLSDYEVERLPQPGSAVAGSGSLPFHNGTTG